MGFAQQYLEEAGRILRALDSAAVERLAVRLAALRERGGRLFLCGVGGGAANASHAAADFRKIAHIEAYALADNIAELTARTNDDGWDTAYANLLRGSRMTAHDGLLVFSVGGGDLERNVSANVVRAVAYAKSVGAEVFGVVGRDGGYTAAVGDEVVLVPIASPATVTPHTEAFQAVVWHLLVAHPLLQRAPMKWESMSFDGAAAPSAPAPALQAGLGTS